VGRDHASVKGLKCEERLSEKQTAAV